jgi:hypothetical protein
MSMGGKLRGSHKLVFLEQSNFLSTRKTVTRSAAKEVCMELRMLEVRDEDYGDQFLVGFCGAKGYQLA